MTTQRSWGRTVTGLSPAGVPPLQAAQIPTKVRKLSQTHPLEVDLLRVVSIQEAMHSAAFGCRVFSSSYAG